MGAIVLAPVHPERRGVVDHADGYLESKARPVWWR